MKKCEMLVNGKWISAKSRETREIHDPANGELVATVPESGREDVISAIEAARAAFDSGPWRKMAALDRSKLLYRVAEGIRAQAKAFAELEVRNCGKPLAE